MFSTIPLYTNDDTMACRFLYSSESSKKVKLLEKGRMLTLLPAALMERALRDQSTIGRVTCCLAPREPVLAMETMESLLFAASHFVTAEQQTKQLENSFRLWAKQALVADEKESRLTEPEGMFM